MNEGSRGAPDTLLVQVKDSRGQVVATYRFATRFGLGRATDNAIRLHDESISRHHLEIWREPDGWWLLNLKSTHGVFVRNHLVRDRERLELPALVSLGASGLFLEIRPADPLAPVPAPGPGAETPPALETRATLNQKETARAVQVPWLLSDEEIRQRLLAEQEADDQGDYTRVARRLIREDRTRRGRGYRKVIWGLAGLFALALGLAAFQYLALTSARALALDMFYDIKTLEVSLAQADIRLEESAETLRMAITAVAGERLKAEEERIRTEQEKIQAERRRVEQERQKLRSMQAKYRDYVKEVQWLKFRLPTDAQYERELINKVAQGLGESELELPEEFIAEVHKYIRYWQSSGRLEQAMRTLANKGYAPAVLAALEQQGLPLYFLYVPLQESNFDTRAIGPETPYGIAKGAWQFLASTGQEFGLQPGPLANARVYDDQDARFDFPQATVAGAKYLKYIYGHLAQASGLLVMASYNYGHNRVRGMLKKMPDNPRDRNYWRFIQQYQLPKETYDYVFYIFSAAVIGEDPKHFGFNFNATPLLGSGGS